MDKKSQYYTYTPRWLDWILEKLCGDKMTRFVWIPLFIVLGIILVLIFVPIACVFVLIFGTPKDI